MTGHRTSPLDLIETPDWMPQVRRIAARLGIPPTEKPAFLLIGSEGEMYDAGAILLAFLDRFYRVTAE